MSIHRQPAPCPCPHPTRLILSPAAPLKHHTEIPPVPPHTPSASHSTPPPPPPSPRLHHPPTYSHPQTLALLYKYPHSRRPPNQSPSPCNNNTHHPSSPNYAALQHCTQPAAAAPYPIGAPRAGIFGNLPSAKCIAEFFHLLVFLERPAHICRRSAPVHWQAPGVNARVILASARGAQARLGTCALLPAPRARLIPPIST